MITKTRGQLGFWRLCALLIPLACCFRTGAVLWERTSTARAPKDEPYYYMTEPLSTPVGSENGFEELSGEETLSRPWLPGGTPSLPWTPEGGFSSSRLPIDPENVKIHNRAGVSFSKEALLDRDISFSPEDGPCVLILHTHGSEAYRDREDYRSTDSEGNVVRVGRELAQCLRGMGISVFHDTTLHDVTRGYDLAYEEAGQAIETWLDKYPTIQVVIDLHRDALSDGAGGQKPVLADLGGETGAALMLVMGTDTSSLPHEHWQENLAFAAQLQGLLEGSYPGLMREISLRSGRYNEHFTPCSILLEVGSAGNSMEEALRSVRVFGWGLAELLHSCARGNEKNP
ncbi:MAG: stage II sporulation protein P [Oscillospiraceae bacterium]|nr:stage II sporulation protein P [Oscillospiraceae bacterium]